MKICEYCAEEIQVDAKKCKHCGEWLQKNDEMTEVRQSENQPPEEPQKLEGFSGWLALFGLGIFVTPILIFLKIITDPESYDGLGIFFNVLIITGYIWLNYLMAKKKKNI